MKWKKIAREIVSSLADGHANCITLSIVRGKSGQVFSWFGTQKLTADMVCCIWIAACRVSRRNIQRWKTSCQSW